MSASSKPTGFEGKVAFVSGAGTGIGRAAALAFARAGASVVVTGRGKDALQETARQVESEGARTLVITCDIGKAGEVKAALEQVAEVFGRLDYAFNNAGVEQPQIPLADIPEEEWERVTGTDLRGTFLCMKYQIPLMLKSGGGAIVNTSSAAGVKGFKGIASYVAAKHGIVGLTKAAALDYADANLRINVVCPGNIDTPMMDRFTGGTEEGRKKAIADEPIGRPGKPEEIAAVALWLCSDAASFMTGSVVVADGGQTA